MNKRVWNLKELLLEKIKKNGGWVNAHAHFDRAFTILPENFHLINAPLQQKWELVDEIKKSTSVQQIYERMARATELMIKQGVQAVGTFIDVDEVIKDKAIQAAQKLKNHYGKQIQIKFINQVLKGVLDKTAKEWFDRAVQFVDIIGGLPGKDKGREEEHLDILFTAAKKTGKLVHVHVDQLNTPQEKESELLADKTLEYGLRGRVVAIHAISLAAQKKDYRELVYKKMSMAGIMVIACPTAWIDSRRSEELQPRHNALTPVDELVPQGITVALGTDNIADIYKPFTDADMWTELRLLLEGCRFYEIDELVKIATVNGLKTLGLFPIAKNF